MKKNFLASAAMIALFLTAGCCKVSEPEVQNVIYLIGDGMGLGAVSSLILSEDSETGGTGINYTGYEAGKPRLIFSTRGHTGTLVPVFAYGAGSESFAGIMKNTDIPERIEELIR